MNAGRCKGWLAGLVFSAAAGQCVCAAQVIVGDLKSQPESLAAAGGTVLVGSASSPYIYRIRSGATTAERFVDASGEGTGTFFFGMLADAGSNTLWACQLTPVPDSKPQARHTVLRSFDLATGAPKVRWSLPGDNNTCNDFAIGPDKALYITDTNPGRIFRLAPGATSAELFSDNRLLMGVDGITFLNGTMYVNNVIFNKLYRIPMDASGKSQAPVDIWMDQPVKGPDGMRAANGKIFVAENGNGRISALTITGDRAHVAVVKDGLNTPTGIEPAGNVLWIAERGAGRVLSVPTPQ